MHENHRGSLRDSFIDATVAGGAAFFGALMAGYPTANVTVVYGGAIAFGVAFFGSLVAARGRRAHGEPPPA